MAEKIVYDIEVQSGDAQAELEAMETAFAGAAGKSDSLASSMSRLTAAQATYRNASEGAATVTGNVGREVTSLNTSQKALKTSNNSLTEALNTFKLGLEGTNDEVNDYAIGVGAATSATNGYTSSLDSLNMYATQATSQTVESGEAIKKTTDSTKKSTKTVKDNTVAVQDNGGAIALLDMVTGGYASVLKNAWEARTVFTTATNAGTVATEVGTASTTKNTTATFAQRVATSAQAVATKIATGVQWAWNAAMNANPIGLVVAGIAVLVGAVYGAIKLFQWWTDETEEQVAASKSLTTSIEAQSDAQSKANKENSTAANQQIALAKATGKSRKQIEKLELKLADIAIATAVATDFTNRNTLTLAKNTLETLKNAGAKEEAIEAQEEAVAEAKKLQEKSEADLVTANDNKIKIQNRHIVAEAEALRTANQKAYDAGKTKREIAKSVGFDAVKAQKEHDDAVLGAQIAGSVKRSQQITTAGQAELNVKKTISELSREDKLIELQTDLEFGDLSFSAQRDQTKAYYKLLEDDLSKTEAEKKRIRKQGEEDVEEINNEELKSYIALAQQIGSTFTALGSASADATRGEKDLAIAGAAISAGAGIASIWAGTVAGDPATQIAIKIAGSIAVAANVAKTIKQINAVKIPAPKGTTPSGGGGANVVTPNFNVVGQSRGTIQSDTAIAEQAEVRSAPLRAYVVSTDITTQQELDRGIETANTIG